MLSCMWSYALEFRPYPSNFDSPNTHLVCAWLHRNSVAWPPLVRSGFASPLSLTQAQCCANPWLLLAKARWQLTYVYSNVARDGIFNYAGETGYEYEQTRRLITEAKVTRLMHKAECGTGALGSSTRNPQYYVMIVCSYPDCSFCELAETRTWNRCVQLCDISASTFTHRCTRSHLCTCHDCHVCQTIIMSTPSPFSKALDDNTKPQHQLFAHHRLNDPEARRRRRKRSGGDVWVINWKTNRNLGFNVHSVQLQKKLGAVLRVMQRVADGSRSLCMHVNAGKHVHHARFGGARILLIVALSGAGSKCIFYFAAKL